MGSERVSLCCGFVCARVCHEGIFWCHTCFHCAVFPTLPPAACFSWNMHVMFPPPRPVTLHRSYFVCVCHFENICIFNTWLVIAVKCVSWFDLRSLWLSWWLFCSNLANSVKVILGFVRKINFISQALDTFGITGITCKWNPCDLETGYRILWTLSFRQFFLFFAPCDVSERGYALYDHLGHTALWAQKPRPRLFLKNQPVWRKFVWRV